MGSYQIIARRGLPGLDFGASHDEVRAFFGPGWESFRRGRDESEGEYWKDVGLFTYYDDAGLLEAMEFAPDLELTLQGQSLFGLSAVEGLAFFRDIDPTLEVSNDGFTSKALGVAVWTEDDPTDDDAEVRSVLLFRDGYYDR